MAKMASLHAEQEELYLELCEYCEMDLDECAALEECGGGILRRELQRELL
jgi:hypothetical protein